MKVVVISNGDKPKQSAMLLSQQMGLSLKAHRLTTGIKVALEDNRRALDIAQGFEDMHLVMQKTDEPTPVDTALVQNVANLVVAGTNQAANSLVPAFTTPDDRAAAEVALTTRTGDIINSFVFEVADILNKLGKNNRVRVNQIDEIRTRLMPLLASFPLPDNPAMDLVRTVTFRPADMNCLKTPEGDVPTFGDLMHAFAKTAAEFDKASKMNIVVCTRLLAVMREMIPSSEIKSPEELIGKVTVANLALFNTVQELWKGIILKGDFVFDRDGTGRTTASTKAGLGLYSFRIAAKTDLPESITVTQQSETIRSFGCLEKDITPITNDEEQCLEVPGVTNALLQLLISDLDRFASDVNKYVTWCATMSEIAEQQCNGDILNLRKFFTKEAVDSLDPSLADTYRSYITMHLGDVNSILQVVQAMVLSPTSAMIALLNDLTTMLTRLNSVVPAGDYNEPKEKPV